MDCMQNRREKKTIRVMKKIQFTKQKIPQTNSILKMNTLQRQNYLIQ